jgi:hypothetical protein
VGPGRRAALERRSTHGHRDAALCRGDLDALHGRFVHAARDDLDTLLAAADEIRQQDARTLRLGRYGPGDPLG